MIAMLLLVMAVLLAQDVSLSDTVITFGQVSAYQQHAQTLTLYNNQNKPLHVQAAGFEETQFNTDLDSTEIAAHSSRQFQIYVQADQNVDYNDFLRIESDGGNRPLIVKASVSVVYSESYYDATQNLWGADLKSALHNIIKNHTQYSYSTVWNILQQTDEDPNNSNNVILLYSGWSYAKSNHGGDPSEWNREHVWAKYHGGFGTDPPAGADVHHLRPTDVTVNSKRGNLDFDEGGTLYTDPDGATGCRYDGDSWEPRDAVKGDVARMMYYMVVRYEGEEGYDLELVDYTPSTTSGAPLFGKLSTLYQWHWSDPVDGWERRRNDIIYNNWQHNRNPFIDHPEFADRLPTISGQPLKNGPEIAVAPQSVNMGEVGFNTTTRYPVAIINTGSKTLHIAHIQATNPDFQPELSAMTIPAETYDYLPLSFTSGSTEGVFSGALQITSDDSDEGYLDIPVTVTVSKAVGIEYPDVSAGNFELYQNYPNPFNPTTRIRYQVANTSRVELAVYDVSGKKVKELVKRNQAAGEHSVLFDARNLASGVYFYRLSAGKFRQWRKMVLLQ